MLFQVDWSVYFVTDRLITRGRPILDVVARAIQGGITVLQLRDKDVPTREMLELGHALLELTRPRHIPLIVNDRIDVALALDADGVHVGQSDMPAALTRRLIGPDRLLGVSAATVEEARQARKDGADYIGAGDVFGTASKPDAGRPIGLDGLRAIVSSVSVPVVAIGGITVNNTPEVIRCGTAGVAVISAISSAEDPERAAQILSETIITTRMEKK